MASVFINEFHYDNAGTDINEFIEIAGPANTNLSGWSIALYRGNGTVYRTLPLEGVIDDEGRGFGAIGFRLPVVQTGENGINDGRSGIALVNGNNLVNGNPEVVEFLSYEGTATNPSITATNGPAVGATSTPINAFEPGNAPVGSSLQREGTGSQSGNFTFRYVAGSNSEGSRNAEQTFNTVPTAVDDTTNVVTGQSKTFNLLTNDTDAEGDDIDIRNVSANGNFATPNQQNPSITTSNGGQVTNIDFETGDVTYTNSTGFAGNDTFTYTIVDENGGGFDAATVTVNVGGTAADETFNVMGGADSINGGAGNDTLNGGAGNDTLNGQTGNDLINGNGGDDILNGGAGNDTLNGNEGSDTVLGAAGNDSLNGNLGDDTVNGGTGNDTINGGAGNDSLIGAAGNDTFIGSVGTDTLRGGDGIDTADYSSLGGSLDVNLAANTATIGGETDLLTDVENVTGTNDVDRFIGNEKDNVFDGRGNSGSETFTGADGNPYTVRGDVVEYNGNQADFNIVGTTDNFTVTGAGIGNDTLRNIEFLKFNDTERAVRVAEALNEGPVAQDDNLTTSEDSALTGSLFADNGNGRDSDITGDSFTVNAVNGVTASVGNQIALGSGALLTVNANGSFSYNPNNRFDSLNQGQTGSDTFTYTIQDSLNGTDTARANITINGVGGVVTPPPTGGGPLVRVNGAAVNNQVISYGGSQDVTSTQFSVSPSNQLNMSGNNWKRVNINPTTLNSNSVLRFEYQGSGAELQGIGFDNDNTVNSSDARNLFRVAGSDVSNPIASSGSTSDGFTKYEINVGINGTFDFLTFVNDDDAEANAEAKYRNVEIVTNGTGTTPPPPVGNSLLNVSLRGATQGKEVTSYAGAAQNPNITATVAGNNNQLLQLQGNGFRKVDIGGYQVTNNTRLGFGFRSQDGGEVQGIGFDNNNSLSRADDARNFFQVAGKDTFGTTDVSQYEVGSSNGFTQYVIPVAQAGVSGSFNFLTFANDDDADASAQSQFDNIQLFEATSTNPTNSNLDITVQGASQSKGIQSYGGASQSDSNFSATVTDNNKELQLEGNGWRRLDITGFEVDGDTTLNFEFRNNGAGEVIGIGFDNNNSISRADDGGKFFQVAGSQSFGNENLTMGSSTSDGFTSYSIEVGDFFQGQFNFLTFGNDDDANTGAISEFRNISLV